MCVCVCVSWDTLNESGVKFEIRHIYREYNQTADALANTALDDENGNGSSEHWYSVVEKNKRKRERETNEKTI